MKNVLKCSFFGLALAMGAGATAHAAPRSPHDPPKPVQRRALEVNPYLVIGGLYLLGGILTVLREPHRKQTHSSLNRFFQ